MFGCASKLGISTQGMAGLSVLIGCGVSLTASATPPTLISGCRSYVATFGEGTSCLSSRSNAASQPPLKKKVT